MSVILIGNGVFPNLRTTTVLANPNKVKPEIFHPCFVAHYFVYIAYLRGLPFVSLISPSLRPSK
jgi:hypothetical protein